VLRSKAVISQFLRPIFRGSVLLKSVSMRPYRVIVHIQKEVMPVFERRYLKRNSAGSCSSHRGGVYSVEALGVSVWVI
jgi:hypothetical protein